MFSLCCMFTVSNVLIYDKYLLIHCKVNDYVVQLLGNNLLSIVSGLFVDYIILLRYSTKYIIM